MYCSFSTLVVAATDMGITMLLMSKELSPRLLLMGCCCGTRACEYVCVCVCVYSHNRFYLQAAIIIE